MCVGGVGFPSLSPSSLLCYFNMFFGGNPLSFLDLWLEVHDTGSLIAVVQ